MTVNEALWRDLYPSAFGCRDDYEPRACPDCEQGKHRNCDGVTWDNEADDFTKCPCAEAGHKS